MSPKAATSFLCCTILLLVGSVFVLADMEHDTQAEHSNLRRSGVLVQAGEEQSGHRRGLFDVAIVVNLASLIGLWISQSVLFFWFSVFTLLSLLFGIPFPFGA